MVLLRACLALVAARLARPVMARRGAAARRRAKATEAATADGGAAAGGGATADGGTTAGAGATGGGAAATDPAARLHPDAVALARLQPWADRAAGARTLREHRQVADLEPRLLSVPPRRRITATAILGGVEYRPPGGGDAHLVFLHGGGWTMRSVHSHDPACRLIADLANVRVSSMEYRLAPEHPFPAAADDALRHYRRLMPDAVGGDSAGGNLAASVLATARDRDIALPRLQWLLYPVTNAAHEHASKTTCATGYGLTTQSMRDCIDAYLPEPADRDDRRASPLLGDMSGLPPAYVASCLADPLRDEAEAYAARLHTAGVAVRLDRFPLIHGFLNATGAPSARAAVEVACAALRDGLR